MLAVNVNSDNVVYALEIMGKGMLGIFIALSVVYGMVILLTKFFPPKDDENSKNE